jgi:hypothetical protein
MPREAVLREVVKMPVRRGLPAIVGYRLGQGARFAETLARQEVAAVSPLKAGAVIAAVWGGIAAITNTYRYKQDKISIKKAVAATASESVGVGLSASAGLIAANVARMVLVTSSASSLFPIAVGSLATAGFKSVWDHTTSRLVDRYDAPPGQD